MSADTGHGHVAPRKDGAKARCGGPAICSVCQRERAQAEQDQRRRDNDTIATVNSAVLSMM